MTESVVDLAEVEQLANALLRTVSPAERRKLLRGMARGVQTANRTRIAAQVEPEGEPFAPRKPKKPGNEGGYPLRFLYPKGDTAPRVCLVKRWLHAGRSFTGYDIEAKAMRTFDWDKVERFIPLRDQDRAAPAGPEPRRGRIRAEAMFRKLRLGSRLRAGATADEGWAGFTGSNAAIARIHQDGGVDHIGREKRAVRYARRRLLGLPAPDRQRLLETLYGHVTAPL